MKKVMKKFKQTLSLILTVAMVVTMVPQNAFSVSAAEPETIEAVTGETSEDVVLNETGTEADETSTEIVPVEEATTEEASKTETVVETAEETEEETVPVETEQVEIVPEETTEEITSEVVNNGENETSYEVNLIYDEDEVTVFAETVAYSDKDYVFTAVANEGYEYLTVKVYTTNENIELKVTEDRTGENYTYKIAQEDITTDITIEITADRIMHNVSVDTNEGRAKVTFTNDCVNAESKIGEGTDLTFTVEAVNEGERVSKVEWAYETTDDEEVYTQIAPSDEGVYTIENIINSVLISVTVEEISTSTLNFKGNDFAEDTDITVNNEVATVEEGVKRVVFTNGTDHLTYAVTTNENVKLETGKKHTYTIAEGTKCVDFTVTATGNYEPLVILSDESSVEGTKGVTKNGKTTYTYSIEANQLAENETVEIDETIESENVKVTFTQDEVILTSASVDGKQVTAEEDGTYKVPYGSTITFTVEAEFNCKITKAVTTTVGATKAKNEKVNANGFTFSVKATADSETVITSEKLDSLAVIDENGICLRDTKGAYTVEYGNVYTIMVFRGNYDLANIKNIELKNDNNPASSTAQIKSSNNESVISVNAADAGKKLTVNVTIGDGEEEKVLTTTMNVLPAIKKVTVAGVTNGKLSQTADTVKEYKLTLNPKTAANTLAAEVTAGEAVNAEVVDGKLVITTNTTEAKTDVAVVKLYDTTTSTEEAISYIEGGTFTVSTTAPAWVNTKPSVALKSSDDKTLTLTLGAKNVETPVNGKVYYKVVVTPQTVEGTTTPKAITEATEKPFYFAKTDAASQEETIPVNNSDAGKGQAWKYDVKVTLVQTTDSTEITKDTTEDTIAGITAFKTAEGKEGVKKGLATKRPYYETNLKLKKGTTTVYTGQSGVTVATVQFGKNTTFTGNISARELTGKLDVNVVDGNKIKVTAGKSLATGKYTIEVTADAPDTMNAATATVVVNVVRGISSLSVSTPSTVLFKENKKAASMTMKLYYSGTPKSKKVTWSIVDADGNALDKDDYLYGKISVKNGKVTVDKNYIVSANEKNNQFKVKVQAADFIGNETTYACTNVVTITSEAVELGEVVIVNSESDYDDELERWIYSYRVVARSGDTINKDQLTNGSPYIRVLKKGVAEKDVYAADDFVSQEAVGFSSNNKYINVNSDGSISSYYSGLITNPVKNIKITATATDGSKNKAVLDKLTVDVKESVIELTPVDGELGLKVHMEDPVYYWYGMNQNQIADTDSPNIEFQGTENTFIRLEVVKKNGEEWEDYSSKDKCCEIDVNGAKIASGENTNTIINGIEKTATVTMKYKNIAGEEVVKTYTITNTASQNEAPTVKVNGTLVERCSTPQTISFTITSKNYDYKDKFVHIEVDNERRKNGGGGVTGSEYINLGEHVRGYLPVNDDGTIDLFVDSTSGVQTYDDYTDYKVWLTFGTVNEEGKFVADTKATVTYIRVIDKKESTTKKSSFKLNTSYKMSLKEGGMVELTGKGKGVDLDTLTFSSDLKNANINGEENKFRDFFEIKGNVLKLKAGLYAEQIEYITGKAAKNDLIGYVSYQLDGETGYEDTAGTVQIKVNFADKVQSFSLTNATILEDEIMTASVEASVGKKPVAITHAYVTDGKFTATADESSVVTLTSQGENKAKTGKNKITLYIVPEGSYYETELASLKSNIETAEDEDKVAAETEYNNAVQKYGIKVATTVIVKDRASTSGKVKISQTDLKQQYTHDTYYVNNETLKGSYSVLVPYTKNVECKIESIGTSNDMVSMEATYDEEKKCNAIAINVEKEKLEQAVEAGIVKYGDELKVTATLKFGEGTKEEAANFTVILPKEKAMTFAEAVETLDEALLSEEIKAEYQWNWSTDELISVNRQKLEKLIREAVHLDCDAEVNIVMDSDSVSLPYLDEEGTIIEKGYISYEVILTNKTIQEGNDNRTESICGHFDLGITGGLPSGIVEKLNQYMYGNFSFSINRNEINDLSELTNEWFEEKIENGFAKNAYYELEKYPSVRAKIEVSEVILPSDDEEEGTVSFSIALYDIRNGASYSRSANASLYIGYE